MLSGRNSIRYLDEGAFFGEDACLSQQERDEDALATSDCILIKVPVGLLLSMLRSNPSLAQRSLSKGVLWK